jgi:predicted DNA-binding ribbon-helix-helix protein
MNDQHHSTGHALKKHSILIAGHRTSLSLEVAFWDQLKAIAGRRRLSLNKLIEEIDRARTRDAKLASLSSAIRVFVLNQLLTERTPSPSLSKP